MQYRATQAPGSFAETRAATRANNTRTQSLLLFYTNCGAIATEKRVSQRVVHSAERGGSQGTNHRRQTGPLPVSPASTLVASGGGGKGRRRRARRSFGRALQPGADVATASGGTDPAAPAPSRDPLAERLKTPRRRPEQPDRARTARSSHRRSLASVSFCTRHT